MSQLRTSFSRESRSTRQHSFGAVGRSYYPRAVLQDHDLRPVGKFSDLWHTHTRKGPPIRPHTIWSVRVRYIWRNRIEGFSVVGSRFSARLS
jgi:hypothetical protein